MKKIKKIKPLLISSSILPLAIVSPIAITSCTNLPTGQIDREEQSNLLSSELAKITLLDSWLTSTYSSLYAQKLKPNDIVSQQLISNTIKYYLDYLTWPKSTSGTLVGSSTEISFANDTLFSQSQKEEFDKNFKEAYKFYVSYKSTVKETSTEGQESTTSPITYFLVKSAEWQKNEYKTLIEIKDTTNKILTINDFNPGLNYTGLDSMGKIIENDFKILVSTRGTMVYQNIMKLLLSEMYFLNTTEKQIKAGTNFNKLTKNINSVNYINTMSYVGPDNDFSEFLLKKYMVENSPQFTWSYSSEDYNIENTSASIISTITEFNNLKTTKETKLSNILSPASTESETNSLSKLQAFNTVENFASSESEKNGDLATDIDSIKTFGDSKIGLLDTEKNVVFSFTELEAIKAIRTHNKNNGMNQIKLMIPSINIKEDSKSKKSHSITIEDLAVSWNNGMVQSPSQGNKFTYTQNGITQELTINSISYKPSDSDSKEIMISFTYSFINGQPANTHSFDYSFTISNWGNVSEGDQINPFATPYTFSGDPNQVGIKIFDESTPTGITYYLRTLPLFKKESQINISGKWYMTGKFTFTGTPWETEEDKKKLIYFYTLGDPNLYKQIQDFYLFNDFNVEGNVYELDQQISSLGLTKKTDDDRRKQGIIF